MKIFLSSFLSFFFFSLPFSFIRADFVEFPAENTANEKAIKASYFNNVADFFSFALAIVFILSIFGMVLSGITFIMAGGNENNLDKARSFLFSSAIGIVISMIGYISLNLLKYFF